MAKSVHNDVLDAALDLIANNGTRMFLCSSEPTNYTEASSTYMLAQATQTVGDGNGHYTISDGATGRKIAFTDRTGIAVSNTGTAAHLVIADSVNLKVLYVDTITPNVAVVSGNTVTLDMADYTIGDPT